MSVSEWLIVHMVLPVGLCLRLIPGMSRRQSIHKIFQLSAVFGGQFCFERMRQSSPHSTHPTITLVVQISASSGQFTSWVYSYPISRANDPHHFSFGQNFAASHAGSLGYVLYSLNRFLGHLQCTRRFIPNHCQECYRRVCGSCGQQLCQDLRRTPVPRPSSCLSCRQLSSCRWIPLQQDRCFGRFPASS